MLNTMPDLAYEILRLIKQQNGQILSDDLKAHLNIKDEAVKRAYKYCLRRLIEGGIITTVNRLLDMRMVTYAIVPIHELFLGQKAVAKPLQDEILQVIQ